MSLETDLDRAIERVERERELTAEKRAALERFDDAVAELDSVSRRPTSPAAGGSTGVAVDASTGPAATGAGFAAGAPTSGSAGSGSTTSGAGSDGAGASVGAVLSAFEEHCGDALEASTDPATSESRPVHEAVAEELSTDVATALYGGDSAGALTPALQRAVRQTTAERVAELEAMGAALEAERVSLVEMREPVADLVEWFLEHNPTPLSELAFDELSVRHEHLGDALSRLDDAAGARQRHLRATTSVDGAVGVAHETLVAYCYADADAEYPALGTLTRAAERCRTARRALRDHLVRRS